MNQKAINTPSSISKENLAAVAAINKIPIIQQILDVVCRTTGMGFAAVARVTEEKWITCTTKDNIAFGLQPGDELKVETTLCHEVRQKSETIFIDNVGEDPIYCAHPTPLQYDFQSYVSVPIIRKDGSFFGTLCAIDPKPSKVRTPEVRGMFSLFAELISFHLEAVEEIKFSETQLAEEKKNSELREQFIAILGHDLKNPLATTRMSADILTLLSDDPQVLEQAEIIKSTSYRMNGLIENILDFARGKLGEGIQVDIKSDNKKLKNSLLQVVKEIQTISPQREIKFGLDITEHFYCDANRVAQLFSNLLSNADTHGDKELPIVVEALTTKEEFILSVCNKGEPIPETAKDHLFMPFYRENIGPEKKGLGLGLFIASEIARAHEGSLEVRSSLEETCFTFKMPHLQNISGLKEGS